MDKSSGNGEWISKILKYIDEEIRPSVALLATISIAWYIISQINTNNLQVEIKWIVIPFLAVCHLVYSLIVIALAIHVLWHIIFTHISRFRKSPKEKEEIPVDSPEERKEKVAVDESQFYKIKSFKSEQEIQEIIKNLKQLLVEINNKIQFLKLENIDILRIKDIDTYKFTMKFEKMKNESLHIYIPQERRTRIEGFYLSYNVYLKNLKNFLEDFRDSLSMRLKEKLDKATIEKLEERRLMYTMHNPIVRSEWLVGEAIVPLLRDGLTEYYQLSKEKKRNLNLINTSEYGGISEIWTKIKVSWSILICGDDYGDYSKIKIKQRREELIKEGKIVAQDVELIITKRDIL